MHDTILQDKTRQADYILAYISKKAFTLAETLITLTVIGVVAALTIPSMIEKFEQKSYVTAWKKTYSNFESAFRQLYMEQGGSLNGVCTYAEIGVSSTDASGGCLLNKILPYMNNMKKCTNTVTQCYHSNYKALNGTAATLSDNQNKSAFMLADGTSGIIYFFPSDSLNHGGISVDVNGNKPPNTVGKDIFRISIGMTKINPWGSYGSYLCCTDPNNANCTGDGCGGLYLIDENFQPKLTYP